MRYLLLIALAVSAFGQDVVPTRRLNFQPATSSPAPTGATIWFKPETVTNANNTPVSFWPDSSGNGFNAGSASGPTWTNNVLNGYGAGYSASTGTLMQGTNALSVTKNIAGASMFCVVKYLTAGAFDVLFDFPSGTTFQRCSLSMTSGAKVSWQGRTLDADSVSTVGAVGTNPTGFFLWEAVVNYSSGKVSVYTNGTLVATSSPLTAANTSNTDSSTAPFYFASQVSGSKNLGVEFLFYNSAVSDATRTNIIEPYFKSKFLLW